MTLRRKRQASDAPMRHDTGSIVIALAPERRAVGASGREACRVSRPCKLTAEQETELRRAAPGRSLRALAADFGVSHETVRTVLRGRDEGACVCVREPFANPRNRATAPEFPQTQTENRQNAPRKRDATDAQPGNTRELAAVA